MVAVAIPAPGFVGAALLRGLSGRDVLLYTQWRGPESLWEAVAGEGLRAALDDASEAALDPRPLTGFTASDVYRVVLVDRADGADRTVLSLDDDLFPFLNVYQVAPGRAEDYQAFFTASAPVTRRQPGYVAAHLHRSTDGRQFANFGLYRSRRDYLAIFRRPSVLASWLPFFTRGLAARAGGLPQRPRIRTYELVTVEAAADAPPVGGLDLGGTA